jgi:hypothetical protein
MMLQRCAQLFSRLGIGSRLAGQGLPERMRTATVALLGVTAAVSMAFVAVIAQQGWTVLSLGPIPAPFVGPQAVGDGTAVSVGEGGSVAPTGGQPGLVATAELTAGSQGAQPGRAPAQPPAATAPSGSSHPVSAPPQGSEPQGAPPSEDGAGEAPPASQPGSPAAPPSSGGGKGTAGVGGEEEGGEVEGEPEVSNPQPPVKVPPEEVDEEEEEEDDDFGSWWDDHGHGHGHGHYHW